MNNSGKNVFIWVIIALVLVLVFNLFNPENRQARVAKVPYSEFLKHDSEINLPLFKETFTISEKFYNMF